MYQEEIEILNHVWHVLIERMRASVFTGKYAHVVDLSTTEVSILQRVDNVPGITPKEICMQTGIPKSTFTSAANRLVKRGFIRREPADIDKRSYRLYLTEEGGQAQAQHKALEHDVLGELLGRLQPQEAAALASLLMKAIEEGASK